jgi:adenylyltransferase/sulfurtransferase
MMSRQKNERYQRQMLLFGEEGQAALKEASVLVAGAGGLGSPVACYLAVAGVGHIRIVDHDRVERSNLNRQILHGEQDIGVLKVDSARETLLWLNPEIEIDPRAVTINEGNIGSLVDGVDLIVDAMDNYPTRYLLNCAAIDRGIPLFHGAIHGLCGQATTIIPGRTACLRCMFPHPPPKETFPVVGVTPGIIGIIQATEVVKYLVGTGCLLENRLALWDGLSCTLEEIPVSRNPLCKDCSGIDDVEGGG